MSDAANKGKGGAGFSVVVTVAGQTIVDWAWNLAEAERKGDSMAKAYAGLALNPSVDVPAVLIVDAALEGGRTMAHKFTIEGFVTQARAEKMTYYAAARVLARMWPGCSIVTIAQALELEASRYIGAQTAELARLGTSPTPEGLEAITREAWCWAVQAVLDDMMPPTERECPMAKSTSYRHLGATWASPENPTQQK